MEKTLLLAGIFVLCLIGCNSAQRLPPIACPQFFEYLAFNQQFIGHISVRHDPQFENNELIVEFSQRGAYDWSYVGSLSLLDDQETVKANLRSGSPINYRVDFPISEIPPKLTQIQLNNVVLCSAGQYSRPRTSIVLKHSLRSTGIPLAFLGSSQFPREQIPQIEFQPTPEERVTERTVPPTARPTPRPRPQFQINDRVEPRPQVTEEPANPVELSAVCGRERGVTTPLIFQGKPVERGQLPWLVGLFERQRSFGLTFFCGATLLSASTVISAAHCFRHPGRDLPASQTVVSLARNTIDVVTPGELRDVSELLIHSEYKPIEYTKADLVLLRLATRVTFSDFIVPICLWNENFPLQLPSGYKTYVAGWGSDESGNMNSKVLKITDTDIVTESDCLRELPARLVQTQTLCSKKVGAGPCDSDGGGGLMLKENNVWLLRGVIAASQRKGSVCDLTKPVVYTDVAQHIAWVRDNMWN